MTNFQNFRSHVLGATVAATALLAGAGMASAATLDEIPGAGGFNDGIDEIYGIGDGSVDQVAGWYGALIGVIGVAPGTTATVTATYLGSEAGFNNGFNMGGSSLTTGGGTNEWAPDSGTGAFITMVGVTNGLLSFSFDFDIGGSTAGTVANGSNPDDVDGDEGPNFFATMAGVPCGGDGTATRSVCVDLWLDDGGADDDDNHDDMLIRLSITDGEFNIIPVPASVPLLLTGLAGLGLVARRKAKKA